MTLCPLGIIRAWFRAAPVLQDGSAWRFSLCVCVFLLFPSRRKDSFHPIHSCRVQATDSAPVHRERRPALVCHAISSSQGWPVWEKLCGWVPKSALHALLFFCPPRIPSTQWKQQQRPRSRALPPNTRLPLVTCKVAVAYTKLTASWQASVAQAPASSA